MKQRDQTFKLVNIVCCAGWPLSTLFSNKGSRMLYPRHGTLKSTRQSSSKLRKTFFKSLSVHLGPESLFLTRVLGPWFYEDCLCLSIPWSTDYMLSELHFSKCEIWVQIHQIHELPLDCRSEKIVMDIVDNLGRVACLEPFKKTEGGS
ncbi:hypothetical protein Scep_019580 [Stephania cephalantha]|uniref:DUF4283 domain-containing protein n=1 Tax=Stephania cephalantha TaxID=152367 RepID=A0AAP0NPY6_9MAGN